MRRVTLLASLLVVFLLAGALLLPIRAAAATTCPGLPSDKGQSAGAIAVAQPGKYALWVRMWAPADTSNSVYAQVDDQCPVTVNDAKTSSGFLWVNFSNGQPAQPIVYTLSAGSHAITLAGREAGAGVDKVLLTSDLTCVPVDMGDNCLRTAPTATNQPTQHAQTPVQKPVQPHKHNWWVLLICLIIILSAAAFMAHRYRAFMQSIGTVVEQPGVVAGGALHAEANLIQRLQHFVRHHKFMVIAWAAVTLAAITIGIVTAATTQPIFEPEDGKLSGGAIIVANGAASGGKYVLFQNNPAGQQQAAGQGGGGNGQGNGGGNGGGNTGGGNNGGGGGNNGGGGGPTAWACALPKYPNASCTGAPAGTSYKTTVSGVYYATKPGEVIDSWHIAGDLVIQTTGVVIKNSLIDGHVDNDSLPLVTSFTITDSTVGPAACDTEGWPSLNAHDFTATRVFLRGHQDGLDVVGDNATMSDSFIQPCYQPPEVVGHDGFHSDGVQDQCGGVCAHMTFTHNTFDSRAFYNGTPTGNSAIYLGSPYNGTGMNAADVVLVDNMFLGGGYSVALWWDNVGDKADWVLKNNVWVQGSWAYGPSDAENTCDHQIWSGNSIVTIDANYALASTVSPANCIN